MKLGTRQRTFRAVSKSMLKAHDSVSITTILVRQVPLTKMCRWFLAGEIRASAQLARTSMAAHLCNAFHEDSTCDKDAAGKRSNKRRRETRKVTGTLTKIEAL
jgi:hypothetical protein